MSRILPGIHSLEQHLEHLVHQPESYRPQRSPHGGKAGIWSHAVLSARPPPREGLAFSLNPLGIPRFRCPHCQRTCLRLAGVDCAGGGGLAAGALGQRTPVPLGGLPDPLGC